MSEVQERLKKLIEKLDFNPNSFAEKVGVSSSVIYHIIGGRKNDPSFELLAKISMAFASVNMNWLLNGQGDMMGYNLREAIDDSLKEPLVDYMPQRNIVVDREGMQIIPIADIKAAAGTGYINTEVLRTSDFIQLPENLIGKGRYLCIRIKGNSMSPTLQDGGYVVIRLIDRGDWKDLITDRVYVISDRDGNTFLKRIRNRLEKGFLVLCSDNPDKATYGNTNLYEQDILSVWYVEWYFSAKMPNVHDQFYSKLQRLEDEFNDLRTEIDQLKNTKS